MKVLVNGLETTLSPEAAGVEVAKLNDRLIVRTSEGASSAVAVRVGDRTLVSYQGRIFEVTKPGFTRKSGAAVSQGEAHAPMPGLIVDVLVQAGDSVTLGQKLLVLEAMKTQQPVIAPFDGTVESIPVSKGEQVVEGALLVKVLPMES